MSASFLVKLECIVNFVGRLASVHHTTIRDCSGVDALKLHVIEHLQAA